MRHKQHTAGYSLIELVIYIGLFVGLSFIIIQSFVVVMKTYATAQRYRTLQHTSELVMERITREIREASSVATAGSIFTTSPGTLALSGEELDGTPYTVSFSVANNMVRITENGVTTDLSSNEVVVQNLTFWDIAGAGNAVRVQLTLQTVKPPLINTTFYTTVNLRQ